MSVDTSNTSEDSLYDDSLDPRRSPPLSDSGDDTCAKHPARYAFAQAFGERAADGACHFDVQDTDMISTVRFNHDASMVATGDKGGRIVLLRRVGKRVRSATEPPEYRFWTQFQSHEPEFDYLKSTEIEEKINEIRWCREVNGAQRLLATNDKTIKLWRVFEKEIKEVVSMTPGLVNGRKSNASSARPSSKRSTEVFANTLASSSELSFTEMRSQYSKADSSSLLLPKMNKLGSVISATPRRVYSNSHAYHINSISLSSDEETFLSADDLRINVWNLHKGGVGFNVVDIKPENMEDLTEVITCAEFHPTSCHIFMHSSSRGNVKLCDLRQAALCDRWAKEFEESADSSARQSFFSEIIASISDIKFSPCGRYILTRDYMQMRLWDVNMESQPIVVVPVQEQLRPHLSEMYENDCIFDKFRCAFSHDGGSLLTGGYRSLFQSFSSYTGVGAAVEATVDFVSGLSGRGHLYSDGVTQNAPPSTMLEDFTDLSRKIMHLDAATSENVAAVAAGPALYMYYVPN